MAIAKRSSKVAFYGVSTDDGVVYHRMSGFTEFATSKNPIEYSRQYVDEEMEVTDVVGYAPSVSYEFDLFDDNPVHKDMAAIADNESVGGAAVRTIIIVDVDADKKAAIKREFSVIPDGEGSSMDAYTYSGSLKVKGEKVFGTAESTDGWKTCVFTESV